jgi:hypothetical protein
VWALLVLLYMLIFSASPHLHQIKDVLLQILLGLFHVHCFIFAVTQHFLQIVESLKHIFQFGIVLEKLVYFPIYFWACWTGRFRYSASERRRIVDFYNPLKEARARPHRLCKSKYHTVREHGSNDHGEHEHDIIAAFNPNRPHIFCNPNKCRESLQNCFGDRIKALTSNNKTPNSNSSSPYRIDLYHLVKGASSSRSVATPEVVLVVTSLATTTI